MTERVGLQYAVLVLDKPNHAVGIELIPFGEWRHYGLNNHRFFRGDLYYLFLWFGDDAPKNDGRLDFAVVYTPVALGWCSPFGLKELTGGWPCAPCLITCGYVHVGMPCRAALRTPLLC